MTRFMKQMLLPLITLLLTPVSAILSADENAGAPPVVTAKAWAISDPQSGEVLWQHDADEPRKAASTTKIMCACTVLRLAEKEPSVLEEWVAVSELSGATTGSTAGLKPGEQVKVGDILLGLLLPSGNDAGNALAEHFHARLAPPDDAMSKAGLGNPILKTRANFIAEMNRVAREIGMKDTIYRSSFGDGGTEKDRTTTARDLGRLAFFAMGKSAFRTLVATRRHQAAVKKPDGTTRQAVWENSNKLLARDPGYDGIKTGITNQAGNCIVASGQRGKDRLHVVLLGCTSDESCYADARSLFEWAWNKRR